jgi:hypothetical protein
MAHDIPPRTGHMELKRLAVRGRWVAIVAAVGVHIAVLFLTPEFVTPSGWRMAVEIETWAPPVFRDAIPSTGFTPLETTGAKPVLVNWSDVNRRLPRSYPWLMWHLKEPSSAMIQVSISRTGRVREAILLESSDNGADDVLLDLARRMRFDMSPLPAAPGIVAVIELSVRIP